MSSSISDIGSGRMAVLVDPIRVAETCDHYREFFRSSG
jgi:hypothetical protein